MSRVLALIAVLVIAPFAHARPETPLASRVPSGAMLYVGWAGTDAVAGTFGDTRTAALLAASDIPEAATEWVPELVAALIRETDDARPLLDALSRVGAVLWQRPFAFAFAGFVEQAGETIPQAVFVCDAGPRADELQAALVSLASGIGHPLAAVLIRREGDVLYVVRGYDDLGVAELLAGPGGALDTDAKFSEALTRLPGGFDAGTLLTAYADVPAIFALVTDAARRTDPAGAEELTRAFTALGFGGIGDASYAIGFDGRDFVASAHLALEPERVGLLRLLPKVGEGLDDATLDAVPADATLAAAIAVELADVFPLMRELVGEFNPEQAGDFEAALRFASVFAGADVERDILAQVGRTWAAFVSPEAGESLLAGVVVNTPRDPEALTRGLRGASLSLTNLANGFLRSQTEGKAGVPTRAVTRDGREMFVLNAPLVAPTWSVAGGNLRLAFYPQTLLVTDEPEAGFGGSDAFATVRELTGDATPVAFTYADLETLTPRNYPGVLAAAQLAFGTGDVFGQYLRTRPPAVVMPTLRHVRANVAPAYAAAWQDKDGLYVRGVEPFPLAGTLLTGGFSTDPTTLLQFVGGMTAVFGAEIETHIE